ncbi:hypothetical protein [Streptomyces sp. N35]|uniref:hypothetical protein n=1 Tax=Streptomyces sp. N35 TaxID=2795730 RepID=UPI0018F3DAFA|nr:hypothetical protein [Streptomyces sp. N35]
MRTNLRRAAIAALASSSLLFAAACGGSAEAEDKPAAKKSESAKPTTPAKPLTKAQVDAALLELKDMPAGWSADRAVVDKSVGINDFFVGNADKEQCQPLLDQVIGKEDGPKPQAYGISAFAKDADKGPYVAAAITAYSIEDAKDLMAGKPSAKGCESFKGEVVSSDGDERATFRFKELPAPTAGDAARSQRLTVKWDSDEWQPVQYDLAVARVEGAIVIARATTPFDADDAAFQAAFKKAVEKVEAATEAAK